MNLNGYILNVSPGTELHDGRVDIAHLQQYAIVVGNANHTRCQVEIKLDNQSVGTWILEPWQVNARIEHPLSTDEKFTAILVRSTEGGEANLGDVSRSHQGLVQAIFAPEKEIPQTGLVYASNATYNTLADDDGGVVKASLGATRKLAMPGAAMGTGLSGHSDQRYGQGEWFMIDEDKKVTITLRLVDLSYGANQPVPTVKPLPRANPLPPQGD